MAQNPRTPFPLPHAQPVSFPEVWVDSNCQERNSQAFEDVTDLMSHFTIAYVLLTYQPLPELEASEPYSLGDSKTQNSFLGGSLFV